MTRGNRPKGTATKPSKDKKRPASAPRNDEGAERDGDLFPELPETPVAVAEATAKPAAKRSRSASGSTPAAPAPAASDRLLLNRLLPLSRLPLNHLQMIVGGVLVCAVVGGTIGACLLHSDAASRPAVSAASLRNEAGSAAAAPRATALVAAPGRANTRAAAGRPMQLGPAFAAAPSTATSGATAAQGPLGSALNKLLAAQRSRNDEDALAARAELRRLIAADPAAAVKGVFEALHGMTDLSSLAVVASLLSSEPDLANRPEVLSALTDMAQRDDNVARRATAVRTLANLPGADGSRIDLLAGMRSDLDPSVREAAALALGTIAEGAASSVASAAAQSLIQGYSNEQDPRVRAMLLYAIRDTRDASVSNTLLQALAQDPDMSARVAAADMLGDVAAAYRPQAMAALAAQFGQETDANFRASIITSIVGCGGLNAVPVLQQLRPSAGVAQAEIDDYLAGLGTGEDEMDKLQAIRLARQQARGEIPVDSRP